MGISCTVVGSFTNLDLSAATTVRSNLGGQGGRCSRPDACAELQSPSTLHEIYLRNVGTHQRTGRSIDLRITNESQ